MTSLDLFYSDISSQADRSFPSDRNMCEMKERRRTINIKQLNDKTQIYSDGNGKVWIQLGPATFYGLEPVDAILLDVKYDQKSRQCKWKVFALPIFENK